MQNNTRYSRQIILPEVGDLGQQKIQNARVLVIGAGGLGCPVLQNLVMAGVGCIGIVDGDVVDESNLHRQSLYTNSDVGIRKVVVAKQVLQQLNPEVEIIIFPEFLDGNNAATSIEKFQIIVDCTDAIGVRYLINDVAVAKRIPVVYASIHKFQGQVSVFNYQNGPSYRCLFPEKEEGLAIPTCEMSGVLGVVPQTLGSFQATEVLKIILGIGEVLSGKLLLYDALRGPTQIMTFAKNQKEIEKGFVNGNKLLQAKNQHNGLSASAFLEKCSKPEIVVIDVREVEELPEYKGTNIIQVPFGELAAYSKSLDKNQEILLFCQSGQRSLAAMQYLEKSGFTSVFHLGKGIMSLKNQLQ
ncbi:ThiF family adenylyltransferase [Flavobacterium sp. RSSA_27]|uniref:ThiF family adenylyltransferase n=1 Tax=Flavobacterium sp. RSSA_27 TaxID=3447667 RepID=UPI003F2FD8E4